MAKCEGCDTLRDELDMAQRELRLRVDHGIKLRALDLEHRRVLAELKLVKGKLENG